MIIFNIATFFWIQEKEKKRLQLVMDARAEQAQKIVSLELQERLLAMSRMAKRHRPKTYSAWKEDAKAYHQDIEGFQSISWFDRNSQPQWTYPNKERNSFFSPELKQALNSTLHRSETTKDSAFSHLLSLPSGENGLLSIHPTHHQGKLTGYMIAVYRAKDLFSELQHEHFDFKINLAGATLFTHTNTPPSSMEEIRQFPFQLGGVDFEIFVAGSGELYSAVRGEEKTKSLLTLSFLFSFFIMIFTFFLVRERRKLEKTSLESKKWNKYLDLALDGANLGIWDWDLITNEVKFDRRWCEMLGLNVDETLMKLKTWEDRVHPDDLSACYMDIQAYMDGKTKHYENIHRMRHKNGQWIYILDRGRFSEWDKLGKPTRFTGTHFDITASKIQEENLKQLKEQAEKLAQTKSDFLANMSHEIRTPMNGIMGMVSILETTELNSDQKDMLRTVKSSGDILLTVLNDVLDFTKIEAGKVQFEQVLFSVDELLRQSIALLLFTATQKEIELRYKIDQSVPACLIGDPTRIKQILTNFISNGLKFTSEGNVTVHVSAKPSSGGKQAVLFEVVDSGIGISKENQKHLFESFSQADNTITRKYGGSGLGLAICAKLAEAMSGVVRVESDQGKGSTFSLYIPLHAGNESDLGKKVSLTNPESLGKTLPAKFLVAEDNKINQKVISAMLRRLGYLCTVVENGQAALEICQKESFDIIFMDMQMPVMDGLTATRMILDLQLPSAPLIIAMTANAFQEDKEKCFEAGMVDFISKPIDIDDLGSTLSQHLLQRQKAA